MNAFYMYGYRVNDSTSASLKSVYGDQAFMLDIGHLQQTFDSRWAWNHGIEESDVPSITPRVAELKN